MAQIKEQCKINFDQTIISIWRGQHIVSLLLLLKVVLGKDYAMIILNSHSMIPSWVACLSQEELIHKQN